MDKTKNRKQMLELPTKTNRHTTHRKTKNLQYNTQNLKNRIHHKQHRNSNIHDILLQQHNTKQMGIRKNNHQHNSINHDERMVQIKIIIKSFV